jgi:hypothetical protein
MSTLTLTLMLALPAAGPVTGERAYDGYPDATRRRLVEDYDREVDVARIAVTAAEAALRNARRDKEKEVYAAALDHSRKELKRIERNSPPLVKQPLTRVDKLTKEVYDLEEHIQDLRLQFEGQRDMFKRRKTSLAINSAERRLALLKRMLPKEAKP